MKNIDYKKIEIVIILACVTFVGWIVVLAYNLSHLSEGESTIVKPIGTAVFSDDSPTLGGSFDKFIPLKLEGWGAGWYTTPEYDGNDFPDDGLVEATNIDFDIKKSIAPRLGSKVLGVESSNTHPVRSLFTAHSWDGRELLIRTSTTTVEWWNNTAEEWEELADGFTADKTFTFAEGATSAEDWNYLYFSNGTDSIYKMRVAFGTIATNTATTITLNSVGDYDSADDIGFPTSGSVVVNGTKYTYSGISGWQLTGFSGLPSFTANEGIIMAATNSGFTSAPASAESLVIKDQRLYVAYKNSVYASKIDDFTDFSYSSPRVASEGEIVIFPEGGEKITALAVRPTYVAVFKNNYIGSLEFKDFSDNLSDIPVVSTIAQGVDIGATNKNAVGQRDYAVVYVNNDIGLTELTRLEQKDYDQAVKLSERLRMTFDDYDFGESAITIFNNKILLSAKDNSSFNNKVIVYDYTKDRFTEFSGWNVNAWAIYNGKLYFGDSLTQNVRQAFYDVYTDDGNPYVVRAKTKWYNFGEPSRWKEIGWVFVEGFITQNTDITFKINFDEGGALASKSVTISGTGDYVAQEPAGGFGINPFGLSNFGTTGDEGSLRHFAGWINLQDVYDKKFRNIQFEISTSGTDQNFRISKIWPYIYILDEQYGREFTEFIIND